MAIEKNMKNSGEKASKRRSRHSKNYLPVDCNASEITIEILTRKKERKKRKEDSSSELTSDSSEQVKIKYPEKTKNKQTAIPSTDYGTRSTGGFGTGTKTVESLGGACKFISNQSSKVLEAFTKQFKPIIPVYHHHQCICKKEHKEREQQEKQTQKAEAKKKKKTKIKTPRKTCCKRKKKDPSKVVICADTSNLGSSETLEPDPPNLCECVDDEVNEFTQVFGNLNEHWVPCKCGRDCPANRRYILKKKAVTYTFCNTVDSWKPGFVKICCPICSSIDRPALKTVKIKNILAKSKFQAGVLLSCWPICMLPYFMSQSAILLYCKVCQSYLGQYDKTLGCVKPPEIIKHHIAHLMPRHHSDTY